MKQVDVEYTLDGKRNYDEFKGMKEAKEFVRKIRNQGAINIKIFELETNYN